MTPLTIVFDVNETLLDVRGLDEAFAAVFGSTTARNDWFVSMRAGPRRVLTPSLGQGCLLSAMFDSRLCGKPGDMDSAAHP